MVAGAAWPIGACMRHVGLHIRITDTLSNAIEKAVRLQLPFFQCFLLSQSTGQLIQVTDEDVDNFLSVRRKYFSQMFMHGSYWINLASVKNMGHGILKRELAMAQKLGFTHIIIHPGSPAGGSKKSGIEAAARILNEITAYDSSISVVLENAAHGKTTIGGDLKDFKQLRALLDHPEKVQYCIDTAHAYVYGYDIVSAQGLSSFVALLDDTVGISNIVLLHMNDSFGKCGSRIDRHAAVGQGVIGAEALKAFVTHPQLNHIPILMELPEMAEEEEKKVLALVNAW